MGPKKAAERFAERSRDVDSYRVTLYGSLAATGKGHLTDMAILRCWSPSPDQIVWEPKVVPALPSQRYVVRGAESRQGCRQMDDIQHRRGALDEREFAPGDTRHASYPLTTIVGDQGLVATAKEKP